MPTTHRQRTTAGQRAAATAGPDLVVAAEAAGATRVAGAGTAVAEAAGACLAELQ